MLLKWKKISRAEKVARIATFCYLRTTKSTIRGRAQLQLTILTDLSFLFFFHLGWYAFLKVYGYLLISPDATSIRFWHRQKSARIRSFSGPCFLVFGPEKLRIWIFFKQCEIQEKRSWNEFNWYRAMESTLKRNMPLPDSCLWLLGFQLVIYVFSMRTYKVKYIT